MATQADDEHMPLGDRWRTAAIALIGFGVFLGAILLLRTVSSPDASDLGITAWTERAATLERVRPIVDQLLNRWSLAASMAAAIDPAAVGKKEPSEVWAAMNDAAEFLVSDESKARLATRWSDELSGRKVAHTLHMQIRRYRASVQPADVVIPAMSEEFQRTLGDAIPAWIAAEMPVAALQSFLSKNSLAVTPLKADVKKGIPVRTAAERLEDEAKKVRDAVVTALPTSIVRDDVQRAVALDLELASARESILFAVDRDFAARWMWVLAAAFLVTAATAAIAGSALRIWGLAEGRRQWPIVGYLTAVAGGLIYGVMARGGLPAFLSTPVDDFARLYDLDFETPTLVVNIGAAMAVATLLVAGWTSFLIPSGEDEEDRHLAMRLATLRWSFHTATFLLVAGVLYVYAFLQWPSAFLTERAAALVESGARVTALAAGTIFSTLLLLIYLPASSVLIGEARARQTAAPADDPRIARIHKILEKTGFDGPPAQQILRFVQLFAPLLAAPLGGQIATFLGN